jgi:hypothetical protein
MLKKQIIYLFISLSSISFGQIGGQSIYQFLNLVNSPRQAALGGKILTFYDEDVNQAQYNPASINEEMDNKLSVNYGNYFGDVKYGTMAYAYTFDRHVQTFFAGATYINYGNFDGYNDFGRPTDSFTGQEAALSFGYGYNIPNTDFYVGTNAKLISSSLESYTSFGGALDLGFIYKDENNNINWAFAIRNFGTQFKTYSGNKESLPTEIMVGISQQLENVPVSWHLTFENLQQWKVAFENPNRAVASIEGDSEPEKVSVLNNVLRHTILGLEFFPKKSFNLRLGYNFRRAEELSILEQRNFSGISVGFGLKVNNLKFNYSYSRYTLAANNSLFGMTIDLNN